MDEQKYEDSDVTEIEILRGILSEVQDLNVQLARTEARSEQNSEDVETLREDRISPLEKDVTVNDNRSRRNSLILGSGLTALTLLAGAGASYAITLL